jgi:hypothetical protein
LSLGERNFPDKLDELKAAMPPKQYSTLSEDVTSKRKATLQVSSLALSWCRRFRLSYSQSIMHWMLVWIIICCADISKHGVWDSSGRCRHKRFLPIKEFLGVRFLHVIRKACHSLLGFRIFDLTYRLIQLYAY